MMSIAELRRTDKPKSVDWIVPVARDYVARAAADGESEDVVERQLLAVAIKLAKALMDEFIDAQGDGDEGPVIERQGRRLRRSERPVERKLRTIFGEHVIESYVYAAGAKKAIEYRPLDERMGLPAGRCSYLLEELSQYLCVNQAFEQSSACLQRFFGIKISVNTLENLNQRMGPQAEEFLAELPTPAADQEGELLVASADGKGVRLLRKEAATVPAFENRERKGNKRMATLGCVYSVDRYLRTADDVLAALFRDQPETPPPKRPQAKSKHLAAFFANSIQDGAETIKVSGPMHALSWMATEVSRRRQPEQPLVVLMDGQQTLWDAAAICLDSASADDTVEILDLLHVSQYVWKAASAFHSHREHREAFTRQYLRRILDGKVKAVVASWRQRATKHQLTGQAAEDVRQACNYFSNNAQRMAYDQYLAAGYPIASGVIEGACRHLVKDRMERSGMRWRLDSATAMLNNRAAFISDYWNDFHQARIRDEQIAFRRPPRPHHHTPFTLAA
ncbi:MAG: ISKra4 family transposase [Acidiferrobacterales bacterium]